MRSPLQDILFVKVKGSYLKVEKADIIILEANGDYVKIYTQDEMYVARITLTKMEKLLKSDDFLRIHRSFIIRLESIEQINFQEGSVMVSGRCLPINPKSKKRLLELINILD